MSDFQPPASTGPLSWLRVVDLTDLRGALCARVLADLGADVVRIERARALEELETVAYRYRNANKRGVVLDPSSPEGRGRLDALLAQADVLIENLDADERQRLELTPELVEAAHPALVHVALADFGLSGPRSGWRAEALTAHAASGGMHVSGFPELPPTNAPGYFAHDAASMYGAVGAIAGVLDRARHRHGQLVEVSVQEAAIAGTNPWSIAMPSYLKVNPLLPVEGKRNADGNYWVLPAKDGWVRCIIGSGRPWQGFLKLLGSPDALEGPEWSDVAFRLANTDVVRMIAQERMTDRTRAELFQQALEYGTTVGVMHTVREFMEHEQTRQRGFFVETGFPEIGDLPFAKNPVNFSATPTSIRRPAPAPGQDDGDAFVERPADIDAVRVGRGEGLLLDGIRVVEFGVAAIVPELCMALSELGAEVIKIESLAHPDVLRGAGPSINAAFTFNTEARGRKSVAIDLTTPEGRELALELCSGADVVAENYRGGVIEDFGLGYEAVRQRNPQVIYVSSQGYGQGGPYGRMPAFGPLNVGFAGLHLSWNQPDAPYPCGTTLAHPDHIVGKLLAASVLAALHHRKRTGEGQRLEMAQTESAAYLMGEIYLESARNERDPEPIGNRNPRAVPHGAYPSAGDDRWVAIAVMDDDSWQRLCKVIGRDIDASLSTLEGRLAVQEELDTELSQWTRQRSAEEAAEVLQANGVSAVPVMGPLDQFADPHLNERRFVDDLVHDEVGEEQQIRNPIRMSRLRQRTARSSRCLGVDTEEVLGDILGLTAAEVAELRSAGVCR